MTGAFFFEEEGDFEFQVGALAVQAFDERAEQVLYVLRMQDGPVGLQHFEKTAHVRAFEFLG